MLRFQQICEPEEATKFLKEVEQLDDAYFIDRSKHIPNRSLDGSTNKYYSMSEISMPQNIKDTVRKWFGYSNVEEILINRFYPDMNIGPHKDNNPCPLVSVMFLNEGLQALSCKMEEGWVDLTDFPGKMVTFEINMIHKVAPQNCIRHSIIILRNNL